MNRFTIKAISKPTKSKEKRKSSEVNSKYLRNHTTMTDYSIRRPTISTFSSSKTQTPRLICSKNQNKFNSNTELVSKDLQDESQNFHWLRQLILILRK